MGRQAGRGLPAQPMDGHVPTTRKVAGFVHSYKFQALVTLHSAPDGRPCPQLGAAPRRMVLQGRDDETGRSQFFAALVSCDDEDQWRRGDSNPRVEVTLRLAGEDVPDYLGIGRHFELWLGGGIGDGVITRRLFV